jgi:parvulin-like peptidyl-prolyl isomerase
MAQTAKRIRKIARIAMIALLAMGLTLAAGCGLFKKEESDLPYVPLPDPTTLPAPSGGNTLSVDGEPITVAEIVDVAVNQLRPEAATLGAAQFRALLKPRLTKIVHSRITEIVVYQEARKDFDSTMDDRLNQAVETEIQRFAANYGGDYAAAEKELASRKLTWKSFRELQKKQILTQVYIQKEIGDPQPVTHNDLVAFYDSIKDEAYLTRGNLQFSIIDIRPEAIELADPNHDRTQAAKTLADDVATWARGGQDFAFLAKRYSSDPSREFGGLWSPVEPGSMAPPYDLIERAATDMEPNSIAGPIAAGGHFFIVRLEKKQIKAYKPFGEVQRDVEKRMDEDRREKTFDAVIKKRLDLTKVGDIDTFVEACLLATYNQMKAAYSASEGGK